MGFPSLPDALWIAARSFVISFLASLWCPVFAYKAWSICNAVADLPHFCISEFYAWSHALRSFFAWSIENPFRMITISLFVGQLTFLNGKLIGLASTFLF